MGKWMKRLRMKRISKYAIIICLLLAIVFAGFTVYGARTGNFNVFIHGSSDGVSIQLYTKEDKSDMSNHYSATPLGKWTNYTYKSLCSQSLVPGLGNKNDDNNIGGILNRYMCFSFMLCNVGEKDVDFVMEMQISDNEAGWGGGNAMKALRVVAVEGDEKTVADGEVFAYPEETEEGREVLSQPNDVHNYEPYETIDFITETQIFRRDYHDLRVGEERKFTYIFFLEGQDIECVDNLFGGRLQMRLDITAVTDDN